jgi:hypothetical protein
LRVLFLINEAIRLAQRVPGGGQRVEGRVAVVAEVIIWEGVSKLVRFRGRLRQQIKREVILGSNVVNEN